MRAKVDTKMFTHCREMAVFMSGYFYCLTLCVVELVQDYKLV